MHFCGVVMSWQIGKLQFPAIYEAVVYGVLIYETPRHPVGVKEQYSVAYAYGNDASPL